MRILKLAIEIPVARQGGLLLPASTALPTTWASALEEGVFSPGKSLQMTAALGKTLIVPLRNHKPEPIWLG